MNKTLENLEKRLQTVHFDYSIEIGVIDETTQRKEESISVGITNAQLMFIHENGSAAHNIPRRPVLKLTIEWANKELLQQTIDACIDGVVNNDWSIADVEKELNIMCQRIEKYARKLISDGKSLEPLKYRKGVPLRKTGQLMKSIRCRLIKND